MIRGDVLFFVFFLGVDVGRFSLGQRTRDVPAA